MIPCCPNCDSETVDNYASEGNTDFFMCHDCGTEFSQDFDTDDDIDCDDSDDGQALASAGFGTDEDYGLFNDWCD